MIIAFAYGIRHCWCNPTASNKICVNVIVPRPVSIEYLALSERANKSGRAEADDIHERLPRPSVVLASSPP